MRIAVFGLGYVGSVTAACLASDGHRVWGVDRDRTRVDRLRRGIAPIREPGLDDALARALSTQRLTVTTGGEEAVAETDLALICVGTPTSLEDGTDLSFVLAASAEIGRALKHAPRPYTVVLRSTVPPGTTRDHVLPALHAAAGRDLGQALHLYFNPEFLRQGSALHDFRAAPFTIIGTPDAASLPEDVEVRDLYRAVDAPLVVLNYQEAELMKLACNAFHALKIDFANEIGTLAQQLGADPSKVMDAFAMDTKLNVSSAYLRPGFAFGGSCLPKDVRSLNHIARQHGIELPVHGAILRSNDAHLERIAADLVLRDTGTIGMAGLVFKPNTDDLRESAAMRLVGMLLDAGKEVVVHEPELRLDLLTGANRKCLADVLPDYGTRLVDWDTFRRRSDMILVTRAGIASQEQLTQVGIPWVDLANLR